MPPGAGVSTGVTLTFHGAAGTVTGSKHLLTVGGARILLDAGLFQGRKELRLANWADPPFDPRSIDHVLVSHTHIDHIGFLPRLAKLGLEAPVHLTPAAYELAKLMLLDAAKIQEQDARYANKKGFSKHHPALPLYTSRDAERALALRSRQPYGQWFGLASRGAVRARFINAGHILGSACIELCLDVGGREIGIVYSGDLGRYGVPLHVDPEPLPACDILIVESTYGNRRHRRTSILEQIRAPMRRAFARGGTVLIPAFAVGRVQQITLILRRLMREKKLPEVPIHIDSPMAIDATRIYSRFLDRLNLDPDVFEDKRLRLFPDRVHFHQTVAESKRLNAMPGPRIIVSSSGMLSGGRVLHHLRRLSRDSRNLLLLVGYQADGTRGRALLDGAAAIKMHGTHVPIHAEIRTIHGLSGHADRDELLRWVQSAPRPPRLAFVVHGETEAAETFARTLRRQCGVATRIPALGDEFDLAAELDEIAAEGGTDVGDDGRAGAPTGRADRRG
jgi:metallo-beta-lactamase family protein